MPADPSKRNGTVLRVVPAPATAETTAETYRALAAAEEHRRAEARSRFVSGSYARREHRRRTLSLVLALLVVVATAAITVWLLGSVR